MMEAPAVFWLAAAGLILLSALGSAALGSGRIGEFVYLFLTHGALYGAAVWWMIRNAESAPPVWLILLVAVVLRAISLNSPLALSTDAYRYVWDGRLMWEGISPYVFVPADERLSHLRDAAIYPFINQKERAVTIYPPAAQLVFMAGVWLSDGIAGMRAVMCLSEAVIVVALLGWLRASRLPPSRILIYAWHPLPIWELTSQAHLDAAALAFLALAIWAAACHRQGWSGAALAAAGLVKVLPLALLPALWRRGDWRMPVALVMTALILYAPHVTVAGAGVAGYLGQHLDNEGYVAGWGFHVVWLLRDFALADPSGWHYAIAAATVLAGAGLWVLLTQRSDGLRPHALLLLGTLIVTLPSPHYPWYFALLTILVVRAPHPAVVALSVLCVCLYLPRHPDGLTWTHVYALVYGLPLVILVASLAWHERRRFALWLLR
ncbi:MAG: glycosyltransferase 87 family protein [Hyphomicrobiaceae bacterium]|nr:glycosyltransferase 87 family protein [Hyphomicrobiaceae bacterium]